MGDLGNRKYDEPQDISHTPGGERDVGRKRRAKSRKQRSPGAGTSGLRCVPLSRVFLEDIEQDDYSCERTASTA
jgi:hypothetical protein